MHQAGVESGPAVREYDTAMPTTGAPPTPASRSAYGLEHGVDADTGNPHRILLVRPSALGDVARTVPALVTLRQAYPAARIDWLVHEQFADVVRHHPALTTTIPFPREQLAGGLWRPSQARFAWRWGRQLREKRYDQVFDLQGLFRSGLFTWLTAAPRRVGAATGREFAWLAYNRRHPAPRRLHTVDRMLRLLEAEGLTAVRDMRLYVGDRDRQWFAAYCAEHAVDGEPFATLAPTARWPSKCWPLERYAEIGTRLLRQKHVSRIVVLAAPREQPYVRPLTRQLGTAALCPTTTVGQMMAILEHTRLLVCNDSAPLHVAVGLGKRLVTVFGPTDPELVGPYGRPETVVTPPGHVPLHAHAYRRNDQSLIAQISTQRVWEFVQQQLAAPEPAAAATPPTARG